MNVMNPRDRERTILLFDNRETVYENVNSDDISERREGV
jgi:hypothetical protein